MHFFLALTEIPLDKYSLAKLSVHLHGQTMSHLILPNLILPILISPNLISPNPILPDLFSW